MKKLAKKNQISILYEISMYLSRNIEKLIDLCDDFCNGYYSIECRNNPNVRICASKNLIVQLKKAKKIISDIEKQTKLDYFDKT